MSQELTESIRKLVAPIISAEGLELVDLELKQGRGRWLLRIFIDHPEGINHGHCQHISRLVGTVLEIEDIIPQRYVLEVSSPGLDRPLKRAEDFDRFKERLIKIKLLAPLGGEWVIRGRLKGIKGQQVSVEYQGRLISIPYNNIANARLEVEFPAKPKPAGDH
jgi:ribosome maturation factor RimP